jgi:hypothetical protein
MRVSAHYLLVVLVACGLSSFRLVLEAAGIFRRSRQGS